MSQSAGETLRDDIPPATPGRFIGLLAGLAAFVILYFLTPLPVGMEPEALQVGAVLALMMIWWLTEALPLAVTALVPLVVFPFTGIMDVQNAASAYGDPVVFLFMGGFILAIGMERWGLHRRIALHIVRAVGTHANIIIGGFMLATAFLSMWISNTATVVMMMPIAMSVVTLLMQDTHLHNPQGVRNFATCMLLGLAFAASIGGVSTLVGTPPNAVFAGYVRQAYNIDIGFAQWMRLAVPIAVFMLAACWAVLLLLYPNRIGHIDGAKHIVDTELKKLGTWSRGEKMVALIFGATALLWMLREPINAAQDHITLNDSGISIMGALALFLIPSSTRRGEMLLTWREAERLPWGILLLFGGGLCVAGAVRDSHLAEWLGVQIQTAVDVPEFALILIVAGVVLLITEFMSNVATITTFLPVIAALAAASGYAPLDLMVPATIASSFAFMTPVATAPNAIVFGSGHVKIRQMAFAGSWLNLTGWVIMPLFCYYMMDYVFTH